jgi:hypothetical protein
MLKVRDAIWLLAMAVLASLWYTDRSIMEERHRSAQRAFESEKEHNLLLSAKLNAVVRSNKK